VESHGPINSDVPQFLSELGSWQLAETTGDVRASSFLFQRISVVVQRFNSVLLHDGFVDDDRPELGALPNRFCIFVIFEPPGFYFVKKHNNNNNINRACKRLIKKLPACEAEDLVHVRY